ncbi:hypothetical protein V8E36_008878 [Tilletia maclaganii]
MKYDSTTPVPAPALALALLASVAIKAKPLLGIHYPRACEDLCKASYDCLLSCSRCEYGLAQGWLPKDAHSGGPHCQSRCGEEKVCNYMCHAFQQSCCFPPFGCCPHDARLCVCSPHAPVRC